MRKLWLTRTLPAAEESAQAWRDAGFDPLVEPLLEIEPVLHDPLPADAVIIFTSKNGVDHTACGGQRAICVGDATAAKARAAGYKDVISVDGTSLDVADWILENLPKTQSIIHVSGWHVRGRIVEDLTAAGYLAHRIKVYRSISCPAWPNEPFSNVALYSPLAAETFADLAIKKDVSSLTAICISKATAGALTELGLKSIRIAERPREDELIMAAKIGLASPLAVKGADTLSYGMESDKIIESADKPARQDLDKAVEAEPAQIATKSPWKAFILTGLIASLFGAAGGGYGVFAGLKSQKPNTAAAPAVDLSPLEAKLKNLTTRLEAAEANVKKSAARPTSTGKPVDLSAIEKRLDRIEATPKIEAGDLSGLEKRLDTLEDAPSPEIDPAALTALQSAQKDGFEWPDTSDLEERLQALEAKLDNAREPSVPTDLLDRLETLEADVETAQSENGSIVLNEELEARLTALENRPAAAARVKRVSILAFPKDAMVKAVEENIEGGVFKKTLSRHVRVKDENDPISLIEGIEADIAKGRLEGATKKFDRLPDPIRAAGQAWYDSVKASL